MKKGEFVSRVINGLNALGKDTRISRRYILHVGKNITKDFISKNIENLRDPDLITTIDCLKMKEDNVVSCGIAEFRRCKSLMKSECKLPETLGGFAIVSVTSIDDGTEFKPTNLKQYRRNQERSSTYYPEYYIRDGHLYLPDSYVKYVSLDIITLDTEHICSCSVEECIEVYETEFIVPGKFIENVVKTTIQEIAFKKQIPVDNNPKLDGAQ